jgi:hypothetical protein
MIVFGTLEAAVEKIGTARIDCLYKSAVVLSECKQAVGVVE